MKLILMFFLCQATFSYAEDGFGYVDGLNGDDTNNAVMLPKSSSSTTNQSGTSTQSATGTSNGVRLQIPPSSLEPQTLVVPLPGEGKAPLLYKRDSVEALPNMQIPLPKSKVNGMPQPSAENTLDKSTKKSKRLTTQPKTSDAAVPAKPAQALDAVVY